LEFDRARRHEQAMEGEGGYGIGRALSWKDKCAGKSRKAISFSFLLSWLLLEAADCKLKGAGKKKELKGDLTRKQKYQGITSIAEK